MRICVPLFSLFLTFNIASIAQSVATESDSQQRGYYSRTYLRYEAEPGRCAGNPDFITPPESYSQTPLQAEASNFCAASLSAAGQWVGWTADAPANALSLRFSLPDSPDGKGQQCDLVLMVNGSKLRDIHLDSYWAWQWIEKGSQSKHPDNLPADNKFARMRFDEVYVTLSGEIKAGDTFALLRQYSSGPDCTIDFAELELAPAALTVDDIPYPDKVVYSGDGSDLQTFINQNGGRTIFLPAGCYTVPRRISINADNTRLIGAGMWHTTLMFNAAPDNQRTYSNRGFESYRSGIVIEGLTVNSASNMRYYNNNESLGAGKGLQGSFGKGSLIRDVRIDHFECGAWIGDYAGPAADGLTVEYCRFRNNYADGINLCSGSHDCRVRYCSFRNNGDDDMASWSTGNLTYNNEFSYCTAEHNWRASSLGFFGGRSNSAHHIAIYNGMESGLRLTADFQGTGFNSDGEFSLHDISVYDCGCKAGGQGVQGDLWGNGQPAVLLSAGYWYDINNIRMSNIDVYRSRHIGIALRCSSNHRINNLELHDITIDGLDTTSGSAISIPRTVSGNGHYSNIRFRNISGAAMPAIPANFDFQEITASQPAVKVSDPSLCRVANCLYIHNAALGATVRLYDLCGRLLLTAPIDCDPCVVDLPAAAHFAVINNDSYKF